MALVRPKIRLPCANSCADSTPCANQGTSACGRCLLVMYCGADCQKRHWPRHKNDCKSPLLRDDWQPGWVTEGRAPTFVTDNESPSWQTEHGASKYLWGNMPAIDIVKLVDNEGTSHQGPLNLLFAASGDLRNVVVSLISLPEQYGGGVNMVLNDMDFDVVARNAIMVLLASVLEDPVKAAGYIIHVWYSAFITQELRDVLDAEIKPLVVDVCNKIAGKANKAALRKTWAFPGGHSVALILTKTYWLKLRAFLDVPKGLTFAKAKALRDSVVNKPSHVDFVHRALLEQDTPHRRFCMQRFRDDGILLPFGSARNEYTLPNPTLFQDIPQWPMMSMAEPLHSWPRADQDGADVGPAAGDAYGKLSALLSCRLVAFHSALRCRGVKIQLFHLNAVNLTLRETQMTFDRIEVSNITDRGYLGVMPTLRAMEPMLKSKADNTHATVVALFMNAVKETRHTSTSMAEKDAGKLTKYNIFGPSVVQTGAGLWKLISACALMGEVDLYWDKYVSKMAIRELAMMCGFQMKSKPTIVETRPDRLKERPGTEKAKTELLRLMASGNNGTEHYVEFSRLDLAPGL